MTIIQQLITLIVSVLLLCIISYSLGRLVQDRQNLKKKTPQIPKERGTL